jgi:hypothetical protein
MIQELPGYWGCQETGVARIHKLPGYMGCQNTWAARIHGLPGYKDCQDTGAARKQGQRIRGCSVMGLFPASKAANIWGTSRMQRVTRIQGGVSILGFTRILDESWVRSRTIMGLGGIEAGPYSILGTDHHGAGYILGPS